MTPTTEPPAVSVVIPAHNAAWCVGKAIDSVLAQDYRDFEIVVVDDGSTDDTAKVLATFGDAIRVIHQANGGLSNARNSGIRKARGGLVAFLDADDWWLPGKLTRQAELMRTRPELGFSSTAVRVENPEGDLVNIWSCPNWREGFLVHLFANTACVAGSGSSVIARREIFDKIGGFDETLHSLEDIDMWMRLAAVADYDCIPEALATILKRPGSMSRNLDVMRESAIRVLTKNRPLLPASHRVRFWRACMASIHGDYAKWRYRAGRRGAALLDVMRMFTLAPIARGRLGLGLLRDMLLGRAL